MAKKTKVIVSTAIGDEQSKRAVALAQDFNDIIEVTDELAAKRMDIEGGAFNCMAFIKAQTTEEERANWPDPLSDTGNNPAIYKVRKLSSDGKSERVVDEYFYKKFALSIPKVVAKLNRKDMLERSMKDGSKVNQSDVPDTVKNTGHAYRSAEVSRLANEVNTAVQQIVSGVELYWQFKRFEELKDKVSVEVIYALDENDQPCDGEGDHSYQVEATKQPIVIASTIKGRTAIDNKRVSVGTFKRYNVAKAIEGGGTYQALEKTLEREPQAPQAPTKHVNTVETFFSVLNDETEYLARILESTDKAAYGAVQKAVEKEDTEGDDRFYNLAYFWHSLRSLVDNPRALVRYEKLLKTRAEKEKPIVKVA